MSILTLEGACVRLLEFVLEDSTLFTSGLTVALIILTDIFWQYEKSPFAFAYAFSFCFYFSFWKFFVF
jgi:hypothetical protein